MSGNISWSSGAIAALRALRQHADADGYLFARDIVIALGTGPLPGESVLGDAIRNPRTGVNMNLILQPNTPRGNTGQSVFGIETDAEEKARAEQVRRVSERHILAALTPAPLQQLGVRMEELRSAVEMFELGPTFSAGIAGRWHGLLETSVIIEYQDVREIDWLEETGKPRVTLWVTGSILNELDQLSYRGDSQRVREKARKFVRGILEGAALDRAL